MKKILLCVLDGVGISNNTKGNALYEANTPNLDKLINKYPNKNIEASGEYVGLPCGQIGNSEVGHLTIGAGKVVYQPLSKINNSINDKSFYTKEKIINAINHCKKYNSKLHIMGMLSDGGVHSHINHIMALLDVSKKEHFNNVYLHLFTDGRDTYYNSAKKYFDLLNEKIKECNVGVIASICGRYYAMDRDNRWDRIKKAYDSMVFNKGDFYDDYMDVINSNYSKQIYDEFIVPSIIDKNGNIEDNDSIVWANFRPDRAIEILSTFKDDFNKFETKKFNNLLITTFMWVNDKLNTEIVFENEKLDNTLGIYISKNNLKQLRIAETEKYAHVTFFFDGLKNIELSNCKKVLIPSPKVSTYDLKPEMSASKITDNLLNEMDENYNFIFMNFANGDMVGHTGNYSATIKAVEEIDRMIGKIYDKCLKNNYTFIITADHGNCEYMIDENNVKVTKHTTNKVPFIVCKEKENINDVKSLSDIAPFVLKLLDLKIPDDMKK